MKLPRLAVLALLIASPAFAAEKQAYGAGPKDMLVHLERLKRAYPDVVASYDKDAVRLADGSVLKVSDGRTDKSFEELLNSPDIDDMFAFAYPAGAAPSQPAINFDPGRIRVEALFRAIYGDCKSGAVEKQLRRIDWFGEKLPFTTTQGADKALERVIADLRKLPKAMRKYLIGSGGTYNCRSIAKTNRMSMHAYGASIDISTKYTSYWLWEKPDKSGKIPWNSKVPKEIIDIFERHGFIWGGRWYHFDTMHFEYRPELLPEALGEK
ncbi:MAG: M15 family metallopeptidase [Parvibaculaceae bacterium]